MTKFILLAPLTTEAFGLELFDEIIEALEEFGCGYLASRDILGNVILFATGKTISVLNNMVETVELPGIILEYTAVYDQFVEA